MKTIVLNAETYFVIKEAVQPDSSGGTKLVLNPIHRPGVYTVIRNPDGSYSNLAKLECCERLIAASPLEGFRCLM